MSTTTINIAVAWADLIVCYAIHILKIFAVVAIPVAIGFAAVRGIWK